MLNVENLHAFYGKSHILQGLSFEVRPGEIVALLGRNGSGRSTTAKALMGLVQVQGKAHYKGQSILGRQPFEIARMGLGYVPENRDVFPRLTVHQNLVLGQKGRAPGTLWRIDDAYDLFPQLKARQHTEAGLLSGGEQQMLTLCRTLMGEPELIIIDEPTEGLAPQPLALVGQCLRMLQARGVSVLLIEQKLGIALSVADRVLVMGHGRLVFQGTPEALGAAHHIRQEWLAV